MAKLLVLTPDAKIAEIKRLYFRTRRETITDDLANALRILKSMNSEEERERAAVYMDGLAQMRSDWARAPKGGGDRKRRKDGKKSRKRN